MIPKWFTELALPVKIPIHQAEVWGFCEIDGNCGILQAPGDLIVQLDCGMKHLITNSEDKMFVAEDSNIKNGKKYLGYDHSCIRFFRHEISPYWGMSGPEPVKPHAYIHPDTLPLP